MQLQQLFKLQERQSPLLARQSTPADISKRDVDACDLTPLDPGGEVRGCPVDWTLGMSDNLSLRVAAAF